MHFDQLSKPSNSPLIPIFTIETPFSIQNHDQDSIEHNHWAKDDYKDPWIGQHSSSHFKRVFSFPAVSGRLFYFSVQYFEIIEYALIFLFMNVFLKDCQYLPRHRQQNGDQRLGIYSACLWWNLGCIIQSGEFIMDISFIMLE